ncbi:MAG: NAD(P)H-dependent oxidoreductase [Pseudomonadota bacterium]
MTTHILKIDSSARSDGSISRELGADVIAHLAKAGPVDVAERDVSTGLPVVSSDWIGANFTPADDRSAAQRDELALSDALVAEVTAADVLVIGLPIYNFGLPASLKAWIDLIARAGVTFRYTENGPKGLLEGKRAIVTVASGGTEVGSDIDFATDYLRHVLGFIGITDVTFVTADRMMVDADASLARAKSQIDALAA